MESGQKMLARPQKLNLSYPELVSTTVAVKCTIGACLPGLGATNAILG